MVKAWRSLLAFLVCTMLAMAGVRGQEIHNFYKVDDHVYRGAQPTAEGFRYLATLGVKTIVDLRQHDARSIAESKLVSALGMHYVNVPMSGLTPPAQADITRILLLLEDQKSGAVFVHCRRGADRTGAVIAAYRIDHDQWDNERALQEAMSCGMAFFQLPRQNFIRHFHPVPAVQPAPPDSKPAQSQPLAIPVIGASVAAAHP